MFLSISAAGVWAPVSAHETVAHGPVPLKAPAIMCNYERCGWNSNGQQIDGYKFSNNKATGVGHVGWWEIESFLPPGTTFRIRACVGTIPFRTDDCGPAAEVVTPIPATPEQIIRNTFGSAGGAAVSVARCESGLNPRAVSPGGGNHGLFQINSVHRGSFERVTRQPWSQVYSAIHNTTFAKWLYDQQGWRPWTCKP